MKGYSIQQEILLVTGTRFCSRPLQDSSAESNRKPRTENELLEEACWNGLLFEWLPELFLDSPAYERVYLWNTRIGKGHIHLELGEVPLPVDPHHCIDPYLVDELQSLN